MLYMSLEKGIIKEKKDFIKAGEIAMKLKST